MDPAKPLQLSKTAEFAWSHGDNPGALEFSIPVSQDLQSALLAKLREHGYCAEKLFGLGPPNGALGRYYAAGNGGEWFVRVSSRWNEPELEQAITAHLKNGGAMVNHLEVAGVSFLYDGLAYRLDVRHFFHARHFNDSISDLRAVAASLSQSHVLLRDFPGKIDVKRLSAERFARIEETLDQMETWLSAREWAKFSPHTGWAEKHADWIAIMLQEFDPGFHNESEAQVLHAQMHRGNVLFTKSDGRPVLLDFEEAVHTFAVPAWDWAHFVQRFCLYDKPAEAVLEERLEAIKSVAPTCPPGLVEMMRRAAWLSVAIIVRDYSHHGVSTPREEYDKFIRLEEQARSAAPVINRHFGI